MIKIIDNDFRFFDEFEEYCKSDSFGTRIYSHFLCYGYEFDFADFFVQVNESEVITCAFCKLCGDFVLCLCEDSDFEEIYSFLTFQDKLSVTFDHKYNDKLDLMGERNSGDVLIYCKNDIKTSCYDTVTPQPKAYHNLLLTCKSDDFFVPDYMDFLSDVVRRSNRDLCCVSGIEINDELVSCAMTVSMTKYSVILGAVATHPDHRKNGYAGCIVKRLADMFCDSKRVYIYTTIEKNTRFYEGIGFRVSDKWIKYTYGG